MPVAVRTLSAAISSAINLTIHVRVALYDFTTILPPAANFEIFVRTSDVYNQHPTYTTIPPEHPIIPTPLHIVPPSLSGTRTSPISSSPPLFCSPVSHLIFPWAK